MIANAVNRAIARSKEKGWTKLYWAIDWHDTMCPGTYKKDELSLEFYPDALEVLRWLSNRVDHCIILWTSSSPADKLAFMEECAKHKVFFDYHNANPEVQTIGVGDFSEKFYFDILIDDKSGFDGTTDWEQLKRLLTGTK